jgi:hypothetical protein
MSVQNQTCPTPGKHAHTDRATAVRHMLGLRHGGFGQDLVVYRCQCGAWHVGHSKVNLSKRIHWSLRRSE